MSTKAVSLKLSTEEHKRISVLAGKRQRSAHYLMREAVLDFLNREEQRQSFEDEAEEAWRNYKETGEHLTLEDFQAWVAKPNGPLPQWRK